MGDIALSDLIDPAAEARLRALAAGDPPDDDPADEETKADELVDVATGDLEVKDASSDQIEHKASPVGGGTQVLEADSETGRVVALVSVTGVEDRVKDVIEPGAYTKTMATREPIGVWSHDDKTWVARTENAVELMPGDPFFRDLKTMDGQPWPKEAGAVKVEALFNLETPHGKAAFSDVKFFQGKTGWSIGYRATKAHRNMRTGVRHIKELDWFEYSPVMVGAASQPMTLAVKSLAQPVDADDDHGLVDDELLSTLEPDEVKSYLELRESMGFEVKDMVRTPEGARRFGQPIGTKIVKDRIPANGLEVGDLVDFHMPGGPDGAGETVKGHVDRVERDGDNMKITVDGKPHKLGGSWPVDIQRAQGPGGVGGETTSAESVKARLEGLPEGGTVTVNDRGTERIFTRQGSKMVATDGREVALEQLAGPLFTISSRGGKVTFDDGDKGGDKGGSGPLSAAEKQRLTELDTMVAARGSRPTDAELMERSKLHARASASAPAAAAKPSAGSPKGFTRISSTTLSGDTGKIDSPLMGPDKGKFIAKQKNGVTVGKFDTAEEAAAALAGKGPESGQGYTSVPKAKPDTKLPDYASMTDQEVMRARDRYASGTPEHTAGVAELTRRSKEKANSPESQARAKAGADRQAELRAMDGAQLAREAARSGPAGREAQREQARRRGPGTREDVQRRQSAEFDARNRAARTAAKPSAQERAGGGTPAENAAGVIDSLRSEDQTSELQGLLDDYEKDPSKANADALADALADVKESVDPDRVDAVVEQLRGTKPAAAKPAPKSGGATSRAASAQARAEKPAAPKPQVTGRDDVDAAWKDDERAAVVTLPGESAEDGYITELPPVSKLAARIERLFPKKADLPQGDHAAFELMEELDLATDGDDDAAMTLLAERITKAIAMAYGGTGLKSLDDLEAKRSSASLDRSPKSNWVERAGELPAYFREVARAIHEDSGRPLDEAIPIAIGRVKKWAAGIGNVSAEVRAKAQKAVAEWEALKAKNRMKFDSELLAHIEHKTLAMIAEVDAAWDTLAAYGEVKALFDELGLSTAVEEPVETKADELVDLYVEPEPEPEPEPESEEKALVDVTDLLERALEVKGAVS